MLNNLHVSLILEAALLELYRRARSYREICVQDGDNDGRISKADFESAIRNQDLLLEAFGRCLPEKDIAKRFEKEVLQFK